MKGTARISRFICRLTQTPRDRAVGFSRPVSKRSMKDFTFLWFQFLLWNLLWISKFQKKCLSFTSGWKSTRLGIQTHAIHIKMKLSVRGCMSIDVNVLVNVENSLKSLDFPFSPVFSVSYAMIFIRIGCELIKFSLRNLLRFHFIYWTSKSKKIESA